MSRNASGSYTLPANSVGPAVAGTTISPADFNSTAADIATELTNSLDRGGRGAMTAALVAYAGTVAAPGVTFSGDTDSGLYHAGANDVRIAVAGADVIKATTAGAAITGAATISTTLAVAGVSTLANDIHMTGANTSYAAGSTNSITPKNIAKVWANITTGGSAAIHDGFNVDSISNPSANTNLRVTFAAAMADTNYIVLATVGTGAYVVSYSGGTTTYFDVSIYTVASSPALVNLTSVTLKLNFVVFGVQ